MIWLLIGLGLLAAFLHYGPKLRRADRRVVASGMRGLGGAIAAAAGVWLTMRGGVVIGGPLIVAGLAVLFPGLKLPGFGGLGGLGGGASTEIDTAWIRIQLDPGARPVDGEVKQGAFAGRRLRELSETQVRALLAETRGRDVEATALLEAYVARRFAQGAGRNAPAAQGQMSEEEALAILGLQRGASADEVQAAYKRLMVKVHPDQGGSGWLAAKLNAARERLIGK